MKKIRSMTAFLLALFAMQTAHLEAELIDHLKPALEKGDHLSIDGIDFTYLINLNARPDKYLNALVEISPYGIHPYRFSAIDEKHVSPGVFQDIALKYQSWMTNLKATECQDDDPVFLRVEHMEKIGEPYACLHMTRGSAARWLSHLSVLQDAFLSGYDTIWILEDAIHVVKNPYVLSSLMKELDFLVPDWEVLFTDSEPQRTVNPNTILLDPDHYRPDMPPLAANAYQYKRRAISTAFSWEGSRQRTPSYIIKRSGIEKILNYFKENGLFLTYGAEFVYLPVNAVRLNNPVVTFSYPSTA